MTRDTMKYLAIIEIITLLFPVALIFAQDFTLTIPDRAPVATESKKTSAPITAPNPDFIYSDQLTDDIISFTLPTPIPVSARHSHSGLSWSTGYGLAWKIDSGLALDFGYRYLDYGKVDDGDLDFSAAEGGIVNVSATGRARDVIDQTAHEVSLGLTVAIN